MNRRRFLQLLGLAGAAVAIAPSLVLDPERALWVPGQKTIFDLGAPPLDLIDVSCFTGRRNSFVTIDVFVQETLRVLENNLKLVKMVNREYDRTFPAGTIIGTSLYAPLPPMRFQGR